MATHHGEFGSFFIALRGGSREEHVSMPLGRCLLSRKPALVHWPFRSTGDKLTGPFLTFLLIDISQIKSRRILQHWMNNRSAQQTGRMLLVIICNSIASVSHVAIDRGTKRKWKLSNIFQYGGSNTFFSLPCYIFLIPICVTLFLPFSYPVVPYLLVVVATATSRVPGI